MSKPKRIKKPNWKELIAECECLVDGIGRGVKLDDGDVLIVFEKALVAMYGVKVWDWANKRLGSLFVSDDVEKS